MASKTKEADALQAATHDVKTSNIKSQQLAEANATNALRATGICLL